MTQFFLLVVGLLLLVPTADALECVAIKTAAINPATRECAYFETVCQVPSGWRTVSYCPQDDIQFFTLGKYLPSLGVLVGSFLGFFVLTIILRRFLFSLGQKSQDSYEVPKTPFVERILHFFQHMRVSLPQVKSYLQSFAVKNKMKAAFSEQNHRLVYSQDIQAISQAVHTPQPAKKEESPAIKEEAKPSEGTDWNEFKNTLKKLESLEKKKPEKQ